jgi:uncharacterized membrane protein (UPF0136 family)
MNAPQPNTAGKLPLPGMAAIALWMLMLAVLGVVGVLTHHYPGKRNTISVLLFSTFFAFAALGLLRRKRWGWALSLGAAFLAMSFSVYSLLHTHQPQWIVMGLANLVFFLYLIRSEVIARVR